MTSTVVLILWGETHVHIVFPGLRKDAKGVISGKTLREMERKLFFLLVWSREYYHDILPLQKVIEMEHGKCNICYVFVNEPVHYSLSNHTMHASCHVAMWFFCVA